MNSYTGQCRIREATDQEMIARARRNGSLGNIFVEAEWKGAITTRWIIKSSHSVMSAAEKALKKLQKSMEV